MPMKTPTNRTTVVKRESEAEASSVGQYREPVHLTRCGSRPSRGRGGTAAR